MPNIDESYTVDYNRTVPIDRLFTYMSEYDDLGFQQLPQWLQDTLTYGEYRPLPREPTELEQWDTVADAREHRIVNKELTIQDYLDHYTKGRDISNVI